MATPRKTEKKELYAPGDTSAMNLYQKLVEAGKIIESTPLYKDLSNSMFKSVPIDAMRAAVRHALDASGVVMTGRHDIEIERVDGKRFYAHCVYRFVDSDHPEQVLEVESSGEAMDSGDKGTGKALVNCDKNLFKCMFGLGENSADDIDSYATPEGQVGAAPAPRNSKPDPFFSRGVAKAPAKAGKRPIAKAHLTYDYQPIPNGSLRTMGPDYTGREPEEDGYVHLRDRRSIDEEQVMRCYHSDDGFVVKPFVDRYGPVIQKWTEDQLSEALNAMASNDLLDGQEGGQ